MNKHDLKFSSAQTKNIDNTFYIKIKKARPKIDLALPPKTKPKTKNS